MSENLPKQSRYWRYQVTATILKRESLGAYLDWLLAGHVAEVCKWAIKAEIVHLMDEDGLTPSNRVMSIYWFADRSDFDCYEREGAPKLRTEGVAFASSIGGISFERSFGVSYQIH